MNGLTRIPIASVRPGDIVFFALNQAMPAGHHASHEALVIGRPRGGRVRAVEGNSAGQLSRQRRRNTPRLRTGRQLLLEVAADRAGDVQQRPRAGAGSEGARTRP